MIKLVSVDSAANMLLFNFAVDNAAGSGVLTVQIPMPVVRLRDPNLTQADVAEIQKLLREYLNRKLTGMV